MEDSKNGWPAQTWLRNPGGLSDSATFLPRNVDRD